MVNDRNDNDQALDENLQRLIRRGGDTPQLSPAQKAEMLSALKAKQASLYLLNEKEAGVETTALAQQEAREEPSAVAQDAPDRVAWPWFDRAARWAAAALEAAWLVLTFRSREVSPRSLTAVFMQRARGTPWFAFSVGFHVLLILILMAVRLGWGRPPDTDLSIHISIVEKEEPLDLQKLVVPLTPTSVVIQDVPLADFSKEKEAEADRLSAETSNEYLQQEMDSLVEEEGGSFEYPPIRVSSYQTVAAMMDKEGEALEEAFAKVLEGLVTPNFGPGIAMAVSGEMRGSGQIFSPYKPRKSPKSQKNAIERYGGNPVTQSAVSKTLAFLAHMQQEDGHWSSAADGQFESGSAGPADLAVTGLALLCFEGAGHTEVSGKYQKQVQKAVNWLRQQQSHDGAWTHGGVMYGHGICAMAMAEAYGMARDRSLARDAAQAGVDYIVKVQGPTGGFGYRGPGNDMSVTGWQIFALKSAKIAGLYVPEKTLENLKKFLDNMLDRSTGITGYTEKGQGSLAMTAAGLCCRIILGQNLPEEEVLQKSADLVSKTGPQISQEYCLYYGTLGMFQMGGKRWEAWNAGFSMPLAERQAKHGKYAGSWDPKGSQYGGHGGRVYVTCMNALCLEVYYRAYPP